MKGQFTIDHLAYLSSRRYRRQVHVELKRLSRGRPDAQVGAIVHEDDASCCRWEAWEATARRIVTAVAVDGEAIGWLLPQGDIVGLPKGQEEQLREKFRRAAGGPLRSPGPRMQALLDQAINTWETAGARFCPHPMATPRVLMAHAPQEIRCVQCCAAYAHAHANESAEYECDACSKQIDTPNVVTGPLFGTTFSAIVCAECFATLGQEAGNFVNT